MTGPKTLTVQTALAILAPEGATADSVAAELERRGIKGRCDSSRQCAIAVFFKGLGFREVSIGRYVLVDEFEGLSPEPIVQFIEKFDAGHYPNLIA